MRGSAVCRAVALCQACEAEERVQAADNLARGDADLGRCPFAEFE